MMIEREPPRKAIRIGGGAMAALLIAWLLCVGPAFSGDGGAVAPGSAPNFKKSRLTSDESEATADRRKILLTVGEDRAVDLEFDVNGGANGISVGNETLLKFTLVKIGEKRQIVFKPLKSGDTTVTIRDEDGNIRLIFDARVTGSNLVKIGDEVKDLLRDIEGIEIRVVGQKIIVDGEVLIPADYGRLLAVTTDKAYIDYVLNLTTLSPMTMQVLAKRIMEDINTFAPNVKTRVVNGIIFLEGTVDSYDQAKRAAEIAKLYLPELKPGAQMEKDPAVQRVAARALVQNFLVINPPPPKKSDKLVRVTVHFVELSKDYNKVFGFKWAPGFTSNPQISIGQSDAGTAASGVNFSATLSSLFPKLQSAQAAGYARILKTGTVITKSGVPAKIEQNTQIPFALSNGQQVTASSSTVGIKIAVTPKALGQSEDIELDLDIQQTNLVGRLPATVSGNPQITSSNMVKTMLYVKSNESAAVGGVIASDVGTDFNKDDPNSLTPSEPLFSLLRSKGYRKKKSQFVIFVTPQIVENASDSSEDLKRNFRVKVD